MPNKILVIIGRTRNLIQVMIQTTLIIRTKVIKKLSPAVGKVSTSNMASSIR